MHSIHLKSLLFAGLVSNVMAAVTMNELFTIDPVTCAGKEDLLEGLLVYANKLVWIVPIVFVQSLLSELIRNGQVNAGRTAFTNLDTTKSFMRTRTRHQARNAHNAFGTHLKTSTSREYDANDKKKLKRVRCVSV